MKLLLISSYEDHRNYTRFSYEGNSDYHLSFGYILCIDQIVHLNKKLENILCRIDKEQREIYTNRKKFII